MQHLLIIVGELRQRVRQLEREVAGLKDLLKRIGLLVLLTAAGIVSNLGPEGVNALLQAIRSAVL